MERQEFEREVIKQLATINTKIDNIKNIEENAIEALHKSSQNEKDIKEMKDNQKWAWRTIVGLAIAYVFELFINFKGGS